MFRHLFYLLSFFALSVAQPVSANTCGMTLLPYAPRFMQENIDGTFYRHFVGQLTSEERDFLRAAATQGFKFSPSPNLKMQWFWILWLLNADFSPFFETTDWVSYFDQTERAEFDRYKILTQMHWYTNDDDGALKAFQQVIHEHHKLVKQQGQNLDRAIEIVELAILTREENLLKEFARQAAAAFESQPQDETRDYTHAESASELLGYVRTEPFKTEAKVELLRIAELIPDSSLASTQSKIKALLAIGGTLFLENNGVVYNPPSAEIKTQIEDLVYKYYQHLRVESDVQKKSRGLYVLSTFLRSLEDSQLYCQYAELLKREAGLVSSMEIKQQLLFAATDLFLNDESDFARGVLDRLIELEPQGDVQVFDYRLTNALFRSGYKEGIKRHGEKNLQNRKDRKYRQAYRNVFAEMLKVSPEALLKRAKPFRLASGQDNYRILFFEFSGHEQGGLVGGNAHIAENGLITALSLLEYFEKNVDKAVLERSKATFLKHSVLDGYFLEKMLRKDLNSFWRKAEEFYLATGNSYRLHDLSWFFLKETRVSGAKLLKRAPHLWLYADNAFRQHLYGSLHRVKR